MFGIDCVKWRTSEWGNGQWLACFKMSVSVFFFPLWDKPTLLRGNSESPAREGGEYRPASPDWELSGERMVLIFVSVLTCIIKGPPPLSSSSSSHTSTIDLLYFL